MSALDPSQSEAITLSPGQQASISAGRLAACEVDTYPFTQRCKGFFYFHESTLLEVMTEIGRWYNRTVVFENVKQLNTRVHFVAERSMSLTDIIDSINEIEDINVELSNTDITIK